MVGEETILTQPHIRENRIMDPLPRQAQEYDINQQLGEGFPAAVMKMNVTLPLEITIEQAKEAWQALIFQHEGLRTFFPVMDGLLRQAVSNDDPGIFELQHLNISSWEEFYSFESACRQKLKELNVAPLTIAGIVKNDRKVTVVIFMQHILGDAWSMNLIKTTLIDYCEKLIKGEKIKTAPVIQLGDFYEDQREKLLTQQERNTNYWRSRLTDQKWHFNFDQFIRSCSTSGADLSSLEEDTSCKYPTQNQLYHDPNGAFYAIYMEPELYGQLKKYCVLHKLSINNFLLSSLALVGSRTSANQDLLIRTIYFNRLSKKTHQVIGNLLTDVLHYFQINQQEKTSEFLKRTAGSAMGTIRKAVQDLQPLEKEVQVATKCFMMFNFVGNDMGVARTANLQPPRLTHSEQIWSPLFCDATEYANTILFNCGFHHKYLNQDVVKVLFQKLFTLVERMIKSEDADLQVLLKEI